MMSKERERARERERERDGALVSESDSCLVIVCMEKRRAGQGNLEQ